MEMVSAKAILYKNKNTKELLEVDERERPVSLQLFGSDPKILSEIAASLEDGPYDIFDINMGCPVPKIVKNGEGSALMKNPKLVEEILTSMTRTRTASNMNQYLYLDYAFYSCKMISERISCKHFSAAITSPARLKRFIEKPYRKFLCLNDVRLGEQKFNKMQSAVIQAFEAKFPQKSRFEI